jgi:hypothetical protein
MILNAKKNEKEFSLDGKSRFRDGRATTEALQNLWKGRRANEKVPDM